MTSEQDMKAAITQLRQMTGAGIVNCKQALSEAAGDLKKAQEIIRAKGLDIAKKKASREAREGQIISYIHSGSKLGVLVEINCETDFVARNESFQEFAKNIALQIAAVHPLYVSAEAIPSEILEKEKAVYQKEVEGKPENVREKILQGKLSKRFEDICLLEQKFIRNDSLTVRDYLNETIAKTGENIIIRRFTRYEVGGSDS